MEYFVQINASCTDDVAEVTYLLRNELCAFRRLVIRSDQPLQATLQA